MVEGVKPVQELLASDLEIETLYATEDSEFSDQSANTVLVSKKELERISGLKTPNKVLATVRIPSNGAVNWQEPLILMLDGISDPGNLGTIIRTAKWFGVNQIICSEDCVDAYDRKVVQSTMGALFHLDVIYSNLETVLAEGVQNGFKAFGATMNRDSVYETEKPAKTILVIGSESHGISDKVLALCNGQLTIPNMETERRIESLNAGVATAIILAELTRKA